MVKRIMRAFKLNEISAVDRPAQPDARALIMKRDGEAVQKDMYGVSRFAEIIGSIGYLLQSAESEAEFEGDRSPVPAALRGWLKQGLPVFRAMSAEETEELINAMTMKRAFSASERHKDAKSGAAEGDGSFPIENATDLHNAMRAYGRSKNKAKTKAHIRARAKALGLTSELGPTFKHEDGMVSKLLGFVKGFGVSTDALSESVKSIVADPAAADKAVLIDETIKQFSEHLEGEIEKTLSAGLAGDHSEGDDMSHAIMKALGLAETASEKDALDALGKIAGELEIAKAAMSDDERSFHDGLKDDDAKKAFRALSRDDRGARMKKRVDDLPEDVRKQLADAADMRKRFEAMEAERDLAQFQKRAVSLGLPEATGETLMKASKGDATAWTKIEALIKGLTAQTEAGALFKEFGDNRGGNVDAKAEIMAKATELRKARPEMTIEKAKAAVISDAANADLVKRYNEEERARIAKTRAA